MSGPFIFTFHGRLNPAYREQYVAHCTQAAEVVEAEEPRVIAFNTWESADGTEASCVQVHPDVESLEFHFKIFRERLAALLPEGALEVTQYCVYGEPTEIVSQTLQYAPDADVHVFEHHSSGFLRPQPL